MVAITKENSEGSFLDGTIFNRPIKSFVYVAFGVCLGMVFIGGGRVQENSIRGGFPNNTPPVVHVDVKFSSDTDTMKKNLMEMAPPEVFVTNTVASDDISVGAHTNHDTDIISRASSAKSDQNAQDMTKDTRGNYSNILPEMPQDATNEEVSENLRCRFAINYEDSVNADEIR